MSTPSQPPLRWYGHAWRLVICLVVSLISLILVVEPVQSGTWRYPTDAQLALDVVLGLLCFVVVCFRRRWPVPVAVLTALATCVSTMAAGPASLALVSLATRRRWLEMAPVLVISVGAGLVYRLWVPTPDDIGAWATAIVLGILLSAMIAWGMYLGSRRELLVNLQDRADRAEAENELRAAKARGDERSRIAREMHDVLAHKISQVSMLSGALAYREDLEVRQVQESATLIQQKANEALADLRGVLGVLRDHDSGALLNRPQPTHADLAELFDEARQSGTRLMVQHDPADLSGLNVHLGRTLYRAVQEGLTNARKHAPDALVQVVVTARPEDGVRLQMRNPLGFGSELPGARLGLLGLTERFGAAGGEVTARRVGEEFVLSGWLPWHP